MVFLRHFTQYASSLDEFLTQYDPGEVASQPEAFIGSVSNSDVRLRVAITIRMLDDGGDPSYQEGSINALHAMFGRLDKRHPELEAPMVRRLIEAGADVNLYSRRTPTPLILMLSNDHLPGEDAAPFYDVFLERPELDLSLPLEYGKPRTVREGLEYMGAHTRPLLGEKLRLRDEKFGAT
ncbi:MULTISPECIES: hypothetical protein [unclassified Mycobacterium]|uniref:hypothetical protein n=1 Tax=unclassified Mycobacterium TaxID=2642494 RepID=UPI001116F4A5|nr:MULTISPECIES: hypothetical protein [unclassified Mycobacterium]